MEDADDGIVFDKKTPPCVPGVTPTNKKASIGPSAAAQKVLGYQEKEFYVEMSVVGQIEQMNVIPKQYLLNELAYGSERKSMVGENEQPRPMRKMNYVTATYYLLVKRKELLQI